MAIVSGKRLSLIALVGVLVAPAVAPVASASAACPDAAIVSPAAGAIVVAVGAVPVTIHTCLQFDYTIEVKNSSSVVLASASGLVAAPCGHGDTTVTVAWAGTYVGPATVHLTTGGCFLGAPPVTVSILLIKV